MITAKDRVIAALKGGCADRIPATIMLGPGCPKLCGLPMQDYLHDAAKHAQAHVDVYRRFSFDTLAVGGHVFKEAMALGTGVEYLEDGTSKVVKRPLEDKKTWRNSRSPTSNRTHLFLGTSKFFRESQEQFPMPL